MSLRYLGEYLLRDFPSGDALQAPRPVLPLLQGRLELFRLFPGDLVRGRHLGDRVAPEKWGKRHETVECFTDVASLTGGEDGEALEDFQGTLVDREGDHRLHQNHRV